jgi:hypothetical protein
MPTVETPESVCHFGIARCDITPPVGIYHRMWGAAAHDRSTGVHRPLTASAMVFGPVQGGAEQVLLALDHCILWAPEHSALETAVCNGSGVAADDLVITFSHTHAAGLMGLERVGLPGGELIAPYLAELGRRLAGLVTEARRTAGPAVLSYAAGRCSLAAHRDFWDAVAGEWVCGFNPEAPTDDTALAVRITDDSGRTVATVVNYACHPTTLGWQNTLISPDFPGAMREVVEQATGAPCVFLQGASGDLGPRDGFVADVAVADRNGRQLGYAALSALESLPPPYTRFRYAGSVVSGTKLGQWEHVSLSSKDMVEKRCWSRRRRSVDLAYRAGSMPVAEAHAALARWREEHEDAQRRGDPGRAQTSRAMAEQMERRIVRTAALPPGDAYPFAVTTWRLGNAFWVAAESELYFAFQQKLREALPNNPIVVITLAGGCRASYLPTRETYGKGIYQEAIAVLDAGSLERLTTEVQAELRRLAASPESSTLRGAE